MIYFTEPIFFIDNKRVLGYGDLQAGYQ